MRRRDQREDLAISNRLPRFRIFGWRHAKKQVRGSALSQVHRASSMVKTSRGMFAGRKLCKRRQRFRWAYAPYKRRMLGLDYKAEPLEGYTQARAIVQK